ncbi:MAG: metallophosphoesterase family protein [Clostridia bacterium]|nr:metallophosphoesterase family protein [Clostridia bacterium]
MKKLISILTCAVFLCCTLIPAVFAAATARETGLRFNSDGRFKIVQFSDIQDGTYLRAATKSFLKKTVESEKPDLVVLTGDNIAGYWAKSPAKSTHAIKQFMNIFESLGVPVAIVFGNHDDQDSGFSKEEQMEVYNSFSVSVSLDEGDALSGCGTYNVPILSSDGSKVAFNVWMFDSGTYDEGDGYDYGYDHVHADQVEWYKNKSDELKEANGGEPVYSIAFQHIIVGEIWDALKEVGEGTEGAVEHDGKYYVLPDDAQGVLHETPCPGGRNDGQFASFLEQGDVLATVSGHDHVNTFVIPYRGVDIINTPTCGFRSYGEVETRGARVFVIDEADTSVYETYLVSADEVLGGSADTAVLYKLQLFFKRVSDFFKDLRNRIEAFFGA